MIESERPCITIFENINKRINRSIKTNVPYPLPERVVKTKKDLDYLHHLVNRLAHVDHKAFNDGRFVAGPAHLLLFTPEGLQFIVNYEYSRSIFHLPLPPIVNMAQGYLGFKDHLENFVGRDRFHNFTSSFSTYLRH